MLEYIKWQVWRTCSPSRSNLYYNRDERCYSITSSGLQILHLCTMVRWIKLHVVQCFWAHQPTSWLFHFGCKCLHCIFSKIWAKTALLHFVQPVLLSVDLNLLKLASRPHPLYVVRSGNSLSRIGTLWLTAVNMFCLCARYIQHPLLIAIRLTD